MELVTMSREHYEDAIRDHTAVKMALEYLDECEGQPDIEWLKFILMGCPVTDSEIAILREEDCPEGLPQKKGHRVLAHQMPEEEFDPELI